MNKKVVVVIGSKNDLPWSKGIVEAKDKNAQIGCQVIACPSHSDKLGGGHIYSSLRMPSGVCPIGGIRR